MTDQPRALALADECMSDVQSPDCDCQRCELFRNAAAELRRLHAENERLRSAANRGGHMAAAWELQQADEALLRQALEALENCGGLTKDDAIQRVAAITALRARLGETT